MIHHKQEIGQELATEVCGHFGFSTVGTVPAGVLGTARWPTLGFPTV